MAASHRLIADLSAALGPGAVLSGAADLAAYTEDWRGRYRGPAICVALPSSTEQAAAVVRLSVAQRVPVLPQGGNTSLCGGSVPNPDKPMPVILNLSRMRKIRKLDAANNSIEVEAGCVLANVQEAAARHGRLYGVSLGSEGSCQIGGTISTNAGGTGVLRYGTTRENVLGLEAVLPNGSIWNGLLGLRKNNTGLDLKQLFIGAEGTLGVVTAATLKLHPLPARRSTAWLAPASVQAALDILGACQERFGPSLSAFELMNAEQLDIALRHVPGLATPLREPRPWHLLAELSDAGPGDSRDAELQDLLEHCLQRGQLLDAALAASEAQRSAMWSLRHSVSEGNRKAGVGLTTDTAVPVSSVAQFIEQATAEVRRIEPEVEILIVAHLGDGNVHFIPFFTFERWQALADRDAVAQAIRRSVDDTACALGGTFSAEHGVGGTLLREMQHYKSAAELALMREIKRAIDPADLFNPGRLLPGA